MSSKKIVFFLPNLAGGGAERVAVNLATEFCAFGFEVDFALCQSIGALLSELPSCARVVNLDASRTVTAVFPLSKYLKNEKPYALIAAPDHANLVAVWANMLAGSPARVVATNHIHVTLNTLHTPKLQEKLYPRLLKLFWKHIHALVSVSSGAADNLSQESGIQRQSIHVIYNPIVRPEIERLAQANLDHPWFDPGQPPVILAAGRFESQKDYPTLVAAFALLRKRRQARLVMLGEGGSRSILAEIVEKSGLSNDVLMPGFETNPFSYMARASVFVLSSKWEGFGNVLVEALACGTQVVSTDCPSGPAEILASGRFGRLCPVGDAAAMSAAIETALDEPIPTNLLRERAAEFSMPAAAQQYLHLLGLECS